MEKLSESIKSMGYNILGLSNVVYSIGIFSPQDCGAEGCDGGCTAGCFNCNSKCLIGGIGAETAQKEQ